jgi:hypothetical protein
MQRQPLFRRCQKAPSTIRPALVAALAFASVFSSPPPSALSAEAVPAESVTGPDSTARRKLVDERLLTQRPYACCTDSLKNCLAHKPVCPLATRLHRAVVRMSTDGLSKAQIEAALEQRKATMRADQSVASIVIDDRFRAGSPKAPVTLTLYACPRNPTCATLIPDVYREITTGRLKGKATLVYRPFFPADDREALERGAPHPCTSTISSPRRPASSWSCAAGSRSSRGAR